jgi:hypothetical protein
MNWFAVMSNGTLEPGSTGKQCAALEVSYGLLDQVVEKVLYGAPGYLKMGTGTKLN